MALKSPFSCPLGHLQDPLFSIFQFSRPYFNPQITNCPSGSQKSVLMKMNFCQSEISIHEKCPSGGQKSVLLTNVHLAVRISIVEKCPSVDQNRYANEVLNMCIPFGDDSAHQHPHTKFHHCSPYRTISG